MVEAFLVVLFGSLMSCSSELREEELTILPCFYFCSVEPGFGMPRRRVLLPGVLVCAIVPSKQRGNVVAKIWVQDVIVNEGSSHSLPRSYGEESGKFNASLSICKKAKI